MEKKGGAGGRYGQRNNLKCHWVSLIASDTITD
nr:MAG TPA: hypothetical protein [Caudoviricetes sp.]